jgi:hypothetical protein
LCIAASRGTCADSRVGTRHRWQPLVSRKHRNHSPQGLRLHLAHILLGPFRQDTLRTRPHPLQTKRMPHGYSTLGTTPQQLARYQPINRQVNRYPRACVYIYIYIYIYMESRADGKLIMVTQAVDRDLPYRILFKI